MIRLLIIAVAMIILLSLGYQFLYRDEIASAKLKQLGYTHFTVAGREPSPHCGILDQDRGFTGLDPNGWLAVGTVCTNIVSSQVWRQI